MIYVTPASLPYSHEDSQTSELAILRQDLAEHPTDYLCHPVAWVRSNADWAMEYFKIRGLRDHITADEHNGVAYLLRLYAELRTIANTQETTP